jgi:predicted DNA-binding transcriptional regulator AlpA
MKALGWDDLKERGVPHSKSQIWRKCRNGSFPRPFYIGKFPRWTEEEIDEYLKGLIVERDERS